MVIVVFFLTLHQIIDNQIMNVIITLLHDRMQIRRNPMNDVPSFDPITCNVPSVSVMIAVTFF